MSIWSFSCFSADFGAAGLEQPLPPPSMLRRKIIIKNKKKHHRHRKELEEGDSGIENQNCSDQALKPVIEHPEESSADREPEVLNREDPSGRNPSGNGVPQHHPPTLQNRQVTITWRLASSIRLKRLFQASNESASTNGSSTDADEEPEVLEGDIALNKNPDRGEDGKAPTGESEAGAEISALVNYVQPVHFVSFDESESKF